MRYAYTPEYRKTLDYFIGELEALGFEHYEDPWARSSPGTARQARRCSASARTATRTATAASTTARWASSPRLRSAASTRSWGSAFRFSSSLSSKKKARVSARCCWGAASSRRG